MGRGIRAQFTHTWSQSTIDGQDVGTIAGISPTTWSINPFNEKGPISLSVSWDHSSSFTYSSFTEIDGVPAIAKAYDWVTAAASYDITKNINWASGSVGTSSSVGAGYTAYGRTFTAGVRFGF